MTLPSLANLIPEHPTFRTHDGVEAPIRQACADSGGLATFHEIGQSEAGRRLYGVVLGHGPRPVSLLAGNHADEPVGPETLRTFVLEGLRRRAELAGLFDRFRFVVVPHTNPDGEARNRGWIDGWPDLGAYLGGVEREPPGRDLEFGFPAMRPENRAVADFLRAHAPFALHLSLHGMAFSEGAMLLVERHWCGARSAGLRAGFAGAARAAGLDLHDHNRQGEKGFFYVEPGVTTTPEGAAMRAHFLALGDTATAALFHDSSMEFVRSLGGDPLCLVTELPLFVVERRTPPVPGRPEAYLALREALPEIKRQLAHGVPLSDALGRFRVHPLPLGTAMRLQATTLQLGLEALPAKTFDD